MDFSTVSNQAPVLFFGDQWDRRKRRRQQFATRLASRNETQGVLYVESPLPLTSFVKARMGKADPDAVERWERIAREGALFSPLPRVHVSTPRTLLRLMAQPQIDCLQSSIVRQWVVRSCQRVWSYAPRDVAPMVIVTHPWWPLSFYKSLGLEIDCYDCTDDFSTFPGLPERVRRMLRYHDEEIARSARVVTCVSQSLTEQKLKLNPNTHMVANGVDLDLFASPRQPIGLRAKYDIPEDAKILGYVGGVNRRVDTDLIRTVLMERPHYHLVIAGTNTESNLQDIPRVQLLGQLPLEQVAAFLRDVDVCLIPHKVDDLTRSMDPQKIYDYLATGKPIVSTPVAGTERICDIIHVASTPAEFIAAIDDALNDDPSMRVARLSAAAGYSWENRVESLCSLVFPDYMRRMAA